MDSIAGKVPIVVVKNLHITSIGVIQEAAIDNLNVIYVPDEVVTLGELELDDFLKIVSGKVQKARLTVILKAWRNNHNVPSNKLTEDSMEAKILQAYFKATGISKESIDVDFLTSRIADSITLMQVRDSLRKELGSTLTI